MEGHMTDAAQTEPKKLEGIGGWLVLPPLHLAIDFLLFAWLFGIAIARHTVPLTGGDTAGLQDAIILFYFNGVVSLYAVYCLMRLLQKKKDAPALMTGFYLLTIAQALADAVLLQMYPSLQTAPNAVLQDWLTVVRAVVIAAIFIAYFRRSVRVRNTFVR
jgi:hypothetical protein